MNRRAIIEAGIAALISPVAAGVQAAEKQPTLDETFNWMKTKLEGETDGFKDTYILKRVKASVWREDLRDPNHSVFRESYTDIDLSLLNPSSVVVTDNSDIRQFIVARPKWEVTAYTTGRKRVLRTRYWYRGKQSAEEFYSDHWTIQVYLNQELANRLARALQHAIRLSGGKVDPPKPKEPF